MCGVSLFRAHGLTGLVLLFLALPANSTIMRHAVKAILILTIAMPSLANAQMIFNRDVRPILAEHCLQCHGFDEGARKAGLRLDVRENAIVAAGSGKVAIAPRHPESSELVRRITSKDTDIRMPPDGRLSDEQIRAMEQWVKAGAVWPAEAAPHPNKAKPSVSEQAKDHWAFQPIRTEIIPADVEPSQVPRR